MGETTGKDEKGKEVQTDVWQVLLLSDALQRHRRRHPQCAVPERTRKRPRPTSCSPSTRWAGQKFGRLTGEHVPLGDFRYNLAIVLDDVLQTAPTIQSQITDSGRITGHFTPREVQEIVDIINAGSLPAALEPQPVRDMTTEATLGAETIRQSTFAMMISSIAVPLFMLFYYRFAGLVAVLVLSLNMLMLVALMILFKAPFTLPALAGLALTVGMAVDNNVLIYERLREELAHGAALRMAIRNAFHRVGVVIIDANITHLIAATVLYTVGTEQIKGFAVTFWLGAVLSIWATMFVARVMFEVSERRRWVQKLSMMQWIGHTKIDFMAWFPACATFSVVITVLGLVIAVVRGQGLFDIDFTGGVSVQTAFQQGQKIEDIRDRIDGKEIPENLRGQITAEEIQKELPDATVTVTHSEDEPENQRFIVDTSNPDREQVEDLLKQLFGDKLVTLTLSCTVAAPRAGEASGHDGGEEAGDHKRGKEARGHKRGKEAGGYKRGKEAGDYKKAGDRERGNEARENGLAPGHESSGEEADQAGRQAFGTAGGKAGAKPADPKSADAKSKQSRSDLPPPSLVAMTGDDAVLLALAESPAGKATADPKSETKPQPKAEAESKAESKPGEKAETKPQPKAAAQPKAEAKAENQPPPKVSTVNTPLPTAKVDSPAADSGPRQTFEATLTLSSRVTKLKDNESQQKDEPVRYDEDRLKNVIEQVLEANRIPVEQVKIDLTAPDGSKKSDRWVLKLAPSMEGKNPLTPAKFQTVLSALEAKVRTLPYFPIEDKIGSAVANDTKFWAVVALVSSWSLIILYLWIRFQGVAFGLAAVIALIHDVLVMLGAIAFSSYLALIPGLSVITLIQPFKINLPIVAAFLTIIGYSVNDTIVVFDRIREIRGKSPTLTRQMVNDATNQTLSRTVLTSFTVMLVVIILYIFGGQAVHGFAFALIIGVLTGTYSSIYVAAPILLWLLHPKEMSAASASDKPPQGR